MTTTLIAVGAFGACAFVIGYVLGALTDQEFEDYINQKDSDI